ncbi:hypothetical protein CTI12_AA270650 [Artemisia annua]|uniref:Beta-carotene isomerase D27-like C-terminal domain-containing protein n=1 Tax=Artemisia annua TaxID=35608 RepID=A0A2U1NG15_ARTAN|nr:hypothetical protein CTI12_AA270650 [Artemisia annua]
MGTIIISTPTSIRIPNFVPPKSRWPNHSRLRVKLPNARNALKTEGTITCSNDTTTTKTVYKDNWFDRIAINYMSQALQDTVENCIEQFRKLVPPSKFSRHVCAVFTSVFFRWLVGPCEVRESEFEGVKEKNVVYIKKCRFLETSNCAGMCTNMCKVPAQDFMKNTLGIPINMVPNFDDMSCEYIFGVDPPALQDDPAFKQPCYKLCNVKHKHVTSCMT